MPFGLKNAPSEFCRIMHRILGKLRFVEVYLDDIIIHSASFDEHIDHVNKVLEELSKANLKINLKKCKFALEKVTVLGHIIKKGEIRMDPSKV